MIKKLRKKKCLTQSELAKKIHLSETHVSRMERKVKGFRASYSTIKLLSKHLDECPIKIFIFFAGIDCEYIKLTSELSKNSKCELKNCINDDLVSIFQLNIAKGLRRLRIENARLKKRFKRQRRVNNSISYAYSNRNTKLRN